MKKHLFLILAVAAIFSGSFVSVSAQLKYVPLEPIAGVTNNTVDLNTLPLLLDQIFMILFSLGGLLAVVYLTIGGIQYMLSSIPQVKAHGIEQAKAALLGLLILAGSYLILYTINPELTKLKLTLPNIAEQAPTTTDPNGTGPNAAIPTATCNSDSAIGFRVYYSTDTACVNAVKTKLGSGDILNTSAGPPIIVFESANTIAQLKSALDAFVANCITSGSGGVVKTIGNTNASEPIYACLVRR